MKKMKQLMLLTAVVAMAVGCSSNEYKIVGTIATPAELEGYVMDSVYVEIDGVRNAAPIQNGAFELSGEVAKPVYTKLAISLKEEGTEILADWVNIPIIVEPGEIDVVSDAAFQLTWGGTPQTEAMMSLMDELNAFENNMESTWEELKVVLSNFILAHKDEQVALFGFEIARNLMSNDEQVALAEQCSAEIQADEKIALLLRLRAGQPFVDFEIETENGVAKLSDYVGKGNYVLVDFWASWCMPCRAALPEVKAVYDEFKDKGLVVVGVPTSDEPGDTMRAVEEDGLEFPQMIGVERQAVGALAYGVVGIPHMVLFAPDGTIIARGLNGDNLRPTILENLK